MPNRDYSVPINPPSNRPSFTRASLEEPSDQSSHISERRRIRLQDQTDLYFHLSTNLRIRPAHCSTVYELEDRTKPSVSSF